MLKKAKADANRGSAGTAKRPVAGGARLVAPDLARGTRRVRPRAQQEGMKVFETLVKQGEQLEQKTRQAAAETAAAARGAATAKAKEMQQMAGGTWDKLEQVFEDRVARALSKLGVYTQNDVQRLAERVDALSDAVNELAEGDRARSPAKAANGAASETAQARRPGEESRREATSPRSASAKKPRDSHKGRAGTSRGLRVRAGARGYSRFSLSTCLM